MIEFQALDPPTEVVNYGSNSMEVDGQSQQIHFNWFNFRFINISKLSVGHAALLEQMIKSKWFVYKH